LINSDSTREEPVRPVRAGLLLAALLFAILLGGVIALRPFNNAPDIRSDGVGYHAWAHAIANGDLSFCRYKPLLLPVAALSGESADGARCKNKYPPGVGLLQLVFSWPVLAKHPNETGFSVGENRVVLWGGSVLLFATAAFACVLLTRRGVTVTTTLIAVAAFVFGTGLFHYSTYDASFSHIYSAFGATALMWMIYGRQTISRRRLIAFGLVVAWLYTVRQTNAALSLAVVYVFVRQATGEDRWRVPLAWLLGTGMAASLLLAYGRYVTGEASLSSYGAEGFPSFAGHSLEVLVSYERGLFSYYPLFLIAVLFAITQWRKPTSQVFLALVATFTLLYGSWHAWHLGAGFGHRGFVELAPFGMIVLADGMMSLNTTARRICAILVGLCCLVTVMAMSAYWRGDLPFFGAQRADYWRSISPVKAVSERYTEDDIRHVHLSYQGAKQRPDGAWEVRLLVANGNDATPLRGASIPALSLSWRVAGPQAPLHKGWDERLVLPALAPGQAKSVTIIAPTPDGADQQLQFSIVQEGMFWSHDIGVPPLSVPWNREAAASLNKME